MHALFSNLQHPCIPAVDVTFWDFAGGSEFFEVRKHLYSGTSVSGEKMSDFTQQRTESDLDIRWFTLVYCLFLKICFVVYDATVKASVESVNLWIREVKSHVEDAQIVVLANKVCTTLHHTA